MINVYDKNLFCMMLFDRAPSNISFLIVSIFIFSGSVANAQTVDSLGPLQLRKDFEITGRLKNPVWEKATPVYIKHEVQPNDRVAAPVDTEVKVLYSRHYLYVGFRARDPQPAQIRAHIADRDNVFGDDYAGIFLDPFGNNQHAYELFVNPRGVQFDAKRSGNRENANFDMIWQSAAAVSDSGYTVVMKIPFKSLNFPTRRVQNWSVNFFRNYPRSKRYQLFWTDVSTGNDCLLCQNGQLMNMKGIQNSNTVDIIPYALGYQSGALNDSNDGSSGLDNGPVHARVGGSISYAPTSTSSVDAVINPDFSQVETDATQIGVNQTFALQYPEKRPFFLNEANLFQSGEDLFYSRQINNPLAAGKFTQKSGRYSLAFLTAYDRDTPYVVPGLREGRTVATGMDAYDNILRGKLNIGSQSHIGGLVTTRNTASAHNYLGSLDWRFFLGGHYYINGTAGYTNTRELNDTTLYRDARHFGQSRYDAAFNGQQYGGTFLTAEFEREAKYYDFGFEYKSLAPTFQAQNGFITQTDQRQIEADQGVNYYPDKAWLSRGGLNLHGAWRYDFANVFQERFIIVDWYNYFAGQTHLSVSYLPLNDERFRGRFFTRLHRTTIDFDTQPVDFLSFSARMETGRNIYRTRNPRLGHGYNFSASATIKPTARLKLDLSYSYSTLSPLDDAGTFYSGDISRLKGEYNFSRHLFARLITQYNSFNDQIQIYPLVYYKLNPFTKFYIGMTDYVRHFNQNTPARFKGYRQTNREFFVKFQYLIRS